jgi:hypothetical protein
MNNEFMELNIDETFVAKGATSAMGVDNNGELYYVLRVITLNNKLEEGELTIVIPPMITEQFLRVVNSMGAKHESL